MKKGIVSCHCVSVVCSVYVHFTCRVYALLLLQLFYHFTKLLDFDCLLNVSSVDFPVFAKKQKKRHSDIDMP